MVTRTRAAKEWLRVAHRFSAPAALDQFQRRAEEIRRQRGASQLGKNHLQLALKALSEEDDN